MNKLSKTIGYISLAIGVAILGDNDAISAESQETATIATETVAPPALVTETEVLAEDSDKALEETIKKVLGEEAVEKDDYEEKANTAETVASDH